MQHDIFTVSDPMPEPPVFNRSAREWKALSEDESLYLDFALQVPAPVLPIWSVPVYAFWLETMYDERGLNPVFIGPLKVYDQICQYIPYLQIDYTEAVDTIARPTALAIWTNQTQKFSDRFVLGQIFSFAHTTDDLRVMMNAPTLHPN
jgi:hypothetical protein